MAGCGSSVPSFWVSRDPWEGSVVDLKVCVDGECRRRLVPSDVLTFGRAPGSATHLQVGRLQSDRDSVSRRAGTIRCRDGLWTVGNDSRYYPFRFEIAGAEIWVPPRGHGPLDAQPIPPCGALVGLVTPAHLYGIGLRPEIPPPPDERPDPDSSSPFPGPDTDPSRKAPTPHEVLLLAAKFLSTRDPGQAIGDDFATQRAAQASGLTIAPRAVENCVRRRREELRQLGHTDIDGRNNIDRVGRLLLSYGVLTLADRLHLEPVDPTAS